MIVIVVVVPYHLMIEYTIYFLIKLFTVFFYFPIFLNNFEYVSNVNLKLLQFGLLILLIFLFIFHKLTKFGYAPK